MSSPFPGMDPYLENPDVWPDVQLRLLVAIHGELNPKLPERFAALIDEEEWSDAMGKRHRFLRVHELRKSGATTIVDLISPQQKVSGPAQDAYLSRRKDRSAQGINWVEIDLTRSGMRLPPGIDPFPPSDYVIAETHAFETMTAVWTVSVREPLPLVPVPLHDIVPGIPIPWNRNDVVLDIQKCFTAAYDGGRYPLWVGYDKPLKPPLEEPDATSARELIARTKLNDD